MMFTSLRILALLVLGVLLNSCATSSDDYLRPSSTNLGNSNQARIAATTQIRSDGPSPSQRAAAIAAEPAGDYWIGRRYYVARNRFWGYLRRPGQSWSTAKLVLMDESVQKAPDRLPEVGQGLLNGYDHNFEYRIEGRFLAGKSGYDPFLNRVLPVFQPRSFTVLEQNPGWLFFPGERYTPLKLTLEPFMSQNN